MKKLTLTSLALATLVGTTGAIADEKVSVRLTNLTSGIYFTPLLFAAHNRHTHLFKGGEMASSQLQAMAEGGDISGLASLASDQGAVVVENPAGGLLAPGASAEAQFKIKQRHQRYLSVAAMLLPTNDGFVGLDGWRIPRIPGTYTVDLLAYDAGTEANDEQITGGGAPGIPGIPAAPGGDGGSGGSGVATAIEGFVHIHRGLLGDTDPTGGESDVDSRIHRWDNPVARLTISVR